MTGSQTGDVRSWDVEVAVIGGGAAGLSAAALLGRVRRSVVVIDAGEPRNAPAEGVHGFLSRDGVGPAELLEHGRKEVDRYGGVVVHARAETARRTDEGGFEVVLDDGRTVAARRLLVATGLVDHLPDVPGLRERWGRDVLHCPYCHGWEVRDQAVGVLATGPWAVHQALLFRRLTADLVLFTHTAPPPDDDQAEQLAALGVLVVPGEVVALDVVDDRLAGVRLADGTLVARQALVVAPRFVASSGVLAGLGLRPTEHPMGVGEHVAADPTGLTAVPGVWVAGNVTDLQAQVVMSAAAGVTAAAAINADLVAADTRRAVVVHRAARRAEHQAERPHEVHFTAEFWDERYGSAHRIWSGDPNPQLLAHAADLAPGTALDVGCGEGADAVWLAARGWEVTGIDVSAVALGRAAEHAARAGADVAARTTWQQADVFTWEPGVAQYDLVSAQFMHLPRTALAELHRRLAAAVRPGGTLLVVGHDPSDLGTTAGRPHRPDLMFTAEQVAAGLDPGRWDVVVAAAVERPAVDPEGRTITVRDAVLRATRRREG